MQKTASKIFKRILIFLCIIILLLTAGLWALTVMIYNENFNQRFDSYEPLVLSVEDFQGLQRTQYTFPAHQGHSLTGYLYSADTQQRGIVVMAHGFGGGGHNSYMDCINYFAQNGYYVFAYDATGNDESEGEGVGGLPQGVMDLDSAITFVKESGNFPDLPIVLFGHSWGAYSACSVLTYHPDIKAVVSCSGFNASWGMFEAEGKKIAGDGIAVMMPFVKLHENIKYGSYAAATAMDGFAASDAAILILHSADDETVPTEYGYDLYYAKYQNDPRFCFLYPADRGHSYVYHDQTYINRFNEQFDSWLETLDYDYYAEENHQRFVDDKAEYIRQNLDRSQWCNMLDPELFETFLEFYDANLT